LADNNPEKLKFRYPFNGMTESDILEIFFVEFSTRISDKRLLQNIDAEIWKASDEKVKEARIINETCDKYGLPDIARISDDEVAVMQRDSLVYSPLTVRMAVRKMHNKEYAKLTDRERRKVAVAFDRERMDSNPGYYSPLCKENSGYKSAKRMSEEEECELRHEASIKMIEKIAIREMQQEIQKQNGMDEKVNDVSEEKAKWFSVFDLIG